MKCHEFGKAEQTKRFIIEKAALVFNKQGYAGTSLSDLTQATGLTKGSIYGNFKNKDEVAVCAFQHNVDFIRNAFAQELAAVQSPYKKLLAYPTVYKKIYKTLAANGGCPILNTAVEADDTHHVLHQQVLRAIREWKQGIVTLIKKSQQAGEVKADIDSARIAEIVISLLEGGGLMAKVTGEESYVASAIAQIEALFESIGDVS